MKAPSSTEPFLSRHLRAVVYTAVAVSVLVSAATAVGLIYQNSEIHRLKQQASDYHLSTNRYASEIESEINLIAWPVLADHDAGDQIHVAGVEVQLLDRCLTTIVRDLKLIQELQNQHSDPVFEQSVARLADAVGNLQSATRTASEEAPSATDSLLSALVLVRERCHQLGSLHLVAYRDDLAATTTRADWNRLLLGILVGAGCVMLVLLLGFMRFALAARDRADAEVRRTHDELAQSLSRFRALTEESPALVGIFRDLKTVYVNPTFQAATGYSLEELSNMSVLDVIHPDDHGLVRERSVRRQNGEPAPSTYRFRMLTRAGGMMWVDFTGVRINADGAPAVLGIALDVTADVESESRLRQKDRALTRAARLSTMGEMVAGLAHELAQPLSAISNFSAACQTRLTRAETELDSTLSNHVNHISQQARHAGKILERLRNYVRMTPSQRSLCDLLDLVMEAVELTAHDVRLQGILIEVEIPRNVLVSVDSIQLQQVVVNLIRNATDSMRATQGSERLLRLTAEVYDDEVNLDVVDNGCGLPVHTGRSIFDPFFTTKEHGTGMGLAICRTIVEEHTGSISAETNDSGGATFRIRLPVHVHPNSPDSNRGLKPQQAVDHSALAGASR